MKKLIIISIVLLSIVGGGILFYSQGWLSSSTEDVLSAAIQNMSENKTYHSEAEITIAAESEGETSTVFLNIKEDTDKTDPENPKSDIKFDAELEMEGMSFSLGAEMKVLGQEDIYFRITTIPALPFLDMLGIDFNQLKDQWIKIDEEYLGNALSQNEEIGQKVIELFADREILIVEEEFADEKINDINCYNYLVSLDKEELSIIIPELLEIVMQDSLSLEELSEADKQETLNEMISSFDEFLNKVGDINFKVWLGKKDKQFYQFQIEKEINAGELYEEDMGIDGNVNIDFKMNFSELNKEMDIQSPEEYKSLEEVFPTEMFESEMPLQLGM
jgi:hypothetical protein